MSRDRVDIITGPLLHSTDVQFSQVERICRGLRDSFEFSVIAPLVGSPVRRRLAALGVSTKALYGSFPVDGFRDEAAFFAGSWFLEATIGSNRWLAKRALRRRDGLRLAFCLTMACEADIWWAQGLPIVPTLEHIRGSLSPQLRLWASIGGPVISFLDRRYMRKKVANTRLIYANSQYIADWYSRHGVPIQGVMPSFGADDQFYPATQSPSRDYILAYLGKETDGEGLRRLVATGLPIRIFGSKSQNWVRGVLPSPPPPNVQVLGRVSTEELRVLYTNAAFTAFPFTEEPFGLVPIESMACGTSVLTYSRQGPGSIVLDGRTGWLVQSPKELALKASLLFENGTASCPDPSCIARAREFAPDRVLHLWSAVLENAVTALHNSRNTIGSSHLRRPSLEPKPSGLHARNDTRSLTANRPGSVHLPRLTPGGSFFVSRDSSTTSAAPVVRPKESVIPSVGLSHQADQSEQNRMAGGPSSSTTFGVVEAGRWDREGRVEQSPKGFGPPESGPPNTEPSIFEYRYPSTELIEISFRVNELARTQLERRREEARRPPEEPRDVV